MHHQFLWRAHELAGRPSKKQQPEQHSWPQSGFLDAPRERFSTGTDRTSSLTPSLHDARCSYPIFIRWVVATGDMGRFSESEPAACQCDFNEKVRCAI